MIAASVSSGAVCLRCQLRLLRQSFRPFPTYNPGRILRIQQPKSLLRRFASDSTSRPSGQDLVSEEPGQQEEKEQEKDHERLFESLEEYDGQQEQTQAQAQAQARDEKPRGNTKYGVKRPLDPRKRHLSRNRILTEEVEGLGSSMLGKPGHVIVMRDGGRYEKKKGRTSATEPPEEEEEDDDNDEPNSEAIDIEAQLDSQRKPPTAQEVRENMDGLRPKTETTLPERDFKKLQASLTEGFLSAQLHDYLQHCEQHPLPTKPVSLPDEENEVPSKPHYNWIRNVSPWVPLGKEPSITQGTNPSLYGYLTDSATAKEKLVVRIMRQCWGLSIAELDTGLGETRVKMAARDFVLLMRASTPFFFFPFSFFLFFFFSFFSFFFLFFLPFSFFTP